MSDITKGKKEPLLPLRHTQGNFFVCDIFDAVPKGDIASMEHPIFSLSTSPYTKLKRYENGKNWVEITPSMKGLATIHDRDVLIYCISQVMASLNKGQKVHRTLRFKAMDLLIATNRQTNGQAYEGLKAAFERLRGTTITTNISTGGIEQTEIFGLIDKARIVRETREGRMLDVEITLSDWIFNAIENSEVLTLHRNYFRLRKPLERRLYELARKHCGKQKQWSIGFDLLHKKTGSNSSNKEFRRLIRNIVKTDENKNHMPDYTFRLNLNNLIVAPKPEFKTLSDKSTNQKTLPPLPTSAYEDARKAAPHYDVYYLEQEFRNWWTSTEKAVPKNIKAAFIGFCKKRHKAQPYP